MPHHHHHGMHFGPDIIIGGGHHGYYGHHGYGYGHHYGPMFPVVVGVPSPHIDVYAQPMQTLAPYPTQVMYGSAPALNQYPTTVVTQTQQPVVSTTSNPNRPSSAGPTVYQTGSQYPQSGGSQYYPPTSGSQYPPTSGSQYPPTSGSQYPPTSGSQYPPTSGSQYPPTSGAQYLPPTAGSQYPQPNGASQYPAPQGYGQQYTQSYQPPLQARPPPTVPTTGAQDYKVDPNAGTSKSSPYPSQGGPVQSGGATGYNQTSYQVPVPTNRPNSYPASALPANSNASARPPEAPIQEYFGPPPSYNAVVENSGAYPTNTKL